MSIKERSRLRAIHCPPRLERQTGEYRGHGFLAQRDSQAEATLETSIWVEKPEL